MLVGAQTCWTVCANSLRSIQPVVTLTVGPPPKRPEGPAQVIVRELHQLPAPLADLAGRLVQRAEESADAFWVTA